ncbi:spermidine/putrescine ABC transporter substrate-binding protein [bacterium]|nr:spermidine/putrescine ABC transporter substrate-binding protein [bacterium]
MKMFSRRFWNCVSVGAVTSAWLVIIFGALFIPKLVERLHNSRTINIFAWSDSIDPDTLHDFELQTNIRVNLTYYDSNEELFAKLRATNGVGYDLIVPSDYMVKRFTDENLLQKIDKKKLNFVNRIDQRLLGLPFDPGNDYSIPLEWSIIGICFDADLFQNGLPEKSWSMIFDQTLIDGKLVAPGDARELCTIASLYLFGLTGKSLSPDQINKIVNLLREQKHRVLAYSGTRADLLVAAHNASLAAVANVYVARGSKHVGHLGFAIPKEGGFLTIENFVIPVESKKTDSVYQLLNFLYQPDVIYQSCMNAVVLPVTVDEQKRLTKLPVFKKLLDISSTEFKKLHFFGEVLTDEQIDEIWRRLKAP